MKCLCVILSFTLLLGGCCSHTVVTKDTPLPPPTVEVTFRLNDGTYVLSHEYQRVQNGYKVEGKLVNQENKNSKDFSGIVTDEQIQEVVTNEYDAAKTFGGVMLGIGIVAVFVSIHSALKAFHVF